MKRVGNLIEKIADIDNLRLAFWKAKRGKSDSSSVVQFQAHWNEQLLVLREQLLLGKVVVGRYHYFVIYDPKKRKICAADFGERVLHNALMNICHDVFERVQIYDSYASRQGKGTYAALRRALVFTKKYRWFLKLDVRKYFESIPHIILKQQLNRLFKDKKLLSIFDQIIDSYTSIDCATGLPIGNLTSQYFANHYLAVADHYAQEQLGCFGYVRYMDDMVLWHNDKEKLLQIGRLFDYFVKDKLGLTLKPFCLHNCQQGLPFLGYILYPNKTILGARSRIRFIRNLKTYKNKLQKGEWTQGDYQRHVLPLLAFAEWADITRFSQKNHRKIYKTRIIAVGRTGRCLEQRRFYCRVAYRNNNTPDNRNNNIGFRVVFVP
ncbi:MAG: RNA-directed DNA polymerase [Sphingobacteriales bacterium]|nr:RNA-directed DNA polymerase [Sphingobacteriales bacterium]